MASSQFAQGMCTVDVRIKCGRGGGVKVALSCWAAIEKDWACTSPLVGRRRRRWRRRFRLAFCAVDRIAFAASLPSHAMRTGG